MVKKIIITGAEGFIGSHLTKKLKELDYEVIPFSGDITEKCELPEADCLFHLAALVNIKKYGDDPEKVMKVNVLGTLNVLKAAKDIKKFIYMSTQGVYGNSQNLPFKEERPVKPKGIYSLTKYFGELITQMYCEANTINFNIARSFNVYGPNQTPDAVIPSIIGQVINNNKIILNNTNTTRDFFYIDDLINGLICLIENGRQGEIYNFGSGRETSIREVVNTLEIILNKRIKIDLKSSGRPFVLRSQADITKVKQDLNWEPKISLREGLQKMVDYYGKK